MVAAKATWGRIAVMAEAKTVFFKCTSDTHNIFLDTARSHSLPSLWIRMSTNHKKQETSKCLLFTNVNAKKYYVKLESPSDSNENSSKEILTVSQTNHPTVTIQLRNNCIKTSIAACQVPVTSSLRSPGCPCFQRRISSFPGHSALVLSRFPRSSTTTTNTSFGITSTIELDTVIASASIGYIRNPKEEL